MRYEKKEVFDIRLIRREVVILLPNRVTGNGGTSSISSVRNEILSTATGRVSTMIPSDLIFI